MNEPKPNQRIRVTQARMGYEIGKPYTVVRVDNSDSTLIAADASGKEGAWIRWELCESVDAGLSWDWLKGQLGSDALELLSAFEGLQGLRLKDEVRDHILLQLPNLKERILQSQIQIEEELAASPAMRAAGEPQDEGCPF